MNPFPNREAVEALTVEQAYDVLDEARTMLVKELTSPYLRYHDDPGDYLSAATDNWVRLLEIVQQSGSDDDVVDAIKSFLLEPSNEWLACDGEIRYELCPWGVDSE